MRGDIEMNSLHNTLKGLIPAVAFVFLTLPCVVAASATETLTVEPASIVMGAKYDGLELKVSGTIPADSEVVVRLIGTPKELHLREKGKVFGLLWMNVGKVDLKGVPNVCLINTSSPFELMGKAAAPYRLDALVKSIGIEKNGGDAAIDIPHELLLLKTKEGLYSETAHGITLGPLEAGMRTFTTTLKVPSSLAPGDYQVEAIAIHNDTVTARAATTVKAELTGFPKWLSELAFQKSALYGVMATVIAIVSGLAIGLVFQSKGAH